MGIENHENYKTLNTWVKSVSNMIEAQQHEYFARHEKYFQGLKVPEEKCDGITEKLIAYGKKPDDQEESWSDFAPASFKEGIKFPASVRIDIYQAPSGWGFIVIFDLYHPELGPDTYGNDGDHWQYKTHHGPEKPSGIYDEWYIDEENDL